MFNRKKFIVSKALENKAMLGQHTIVRCLVSAYAGLLVWMATRAVILGAYNKMGSPVSMSKGQTITKDAIQ